MMKHMGDADFNDPFMAHSAKAAFMPYEESLAMVMSMGFSAEQATNAIELSSGSSTTWTKPAWMTPLQGSWVPY